MKLKTILTLLAALGILTACNDDFFDQVPDDRITIEQVFQRTSYSEKYLATVYSYIRDESHRTDGVPWDPCSDDLDVTYDREDYNSFKMNLGNWSASSNYYEYWSHYYRGIRSATYFIQHIGSNQEMLDDPTRGPIVVEQYKNEARFLRAWFYYCLLRQYGPCVLLGDEVLPGDLDRDDVKMNLPRSSYDECVDYIVGELDDMIDNNRLPLHFTVQADKDYGRATLAMCMGLKSRVLLLAASDQFNGNPAYANVVNTDGKHLFSTRKDPEKWNKAAQAAKDVIDLGIFDLYKEYHTDGTLDPYLSCRNVFLENWNSEVMMVRISNYLKHWERSASPRQFSGYESMGATQQLVDAFRMKDGTAITPDKESGYSKANYSDPKSGWVFAPAGTRNMFVNREPRFYVNICFNGAYWIGDQKTRIQLYYTGGSGKKGTWDFPRSGYIAIKNVSPSSNPKNGNYIKRPFVIMRYAEILLNYVEALNEYDPGNADIETYLNKIRFNGAYWIGDQKTRIQLYYTGGSGKKGTWDFPRSGYIAIKNVSPSSNPKNGNYIKRPFVIMRYAEILLNYVEALNEYDPGNADIETYLNKIRERGGLGPVQSDLNQSQMREQIRLERRIELCFEQLRYFDTRRWLIADQTDGGPFYGMNVDAGNSFTDEAFYEKTVFETRVFRPEFYLFPIPQSEINRDPQIVQNPGW